MNSLFIRRTFDALAIFFSLGVVYLLVIYTINVYLSKETAVILIKAFFPVPYISGLALIISAFMVMQKGIPWAVFACIALIFFSLSLRFLKIYENGGEIYEFGPLKMASSEILIALNDQSYCYVAKPFSLELRPTTTGPSLEYFRGVWPSNFSDGSLEIAFRSLGFRTCVA